LSEFIQERYRNYGDPTWLAFLDGFTHRFALHFYRAWAQARPAVSLDRPQEDQFRNQVGSLIGVGTPARQHRDGVHDDARLHFSGRLIGQVRNAESLRAVIQAYFGVAAQLQPWVGRWMTLPASEVTRLGRGDVSRSLGLGTVLGRSIWDRQHQVRLLLGPLTLEQYRQFLPSGSAPAVLRSWLRQLLGDEIDWDAQLVLRKEEVPATRLGQRLGNGPRLGWCSWLGQKARVSDAADVLLSSQADAARPAQV
jgi:type VI secretion system protein ImpH